MKHNDGMERLVTDGICDDIVQRVKSGKEAEVFIVRKGEDYFAAKLYKSRENRSFRNNAVYREGREVRNTRDRRAMEKGSRWGQQRAEEDWIATEHDALHLLHRSGVRVPKPELLYENVLLMELVLDANGQPAPRLLDVALSPEQALEFHRDLIGMVISMLSADLIHGDLSPYNILVAWNGPTIIDLPQVIRAAHNSLSRELLVRDVRNVTEHLARFAPALKRRLNDGEAIWNKYTRRELNEDYFPEEGEWERSRPRRHAPPPGGESPRLESGEGPLRSSPIREFIREDKANGRSPARSGGRFSDRSFGSPRNRGGEGGKAARGAGQGGAGAAGAERRSEAGRSEGFRHSQGPSAGGNKRSSQGPSGPVQGQGRARPEGRGTARPSSSPSGSSVGMGRAAPRGENAGRNAYSRAGEGQDSRLSSRGRGARGSGNNTSSASPNPRARPSRGGRFPQGSDRN